MTNITTPLAPTDAELDALIDQHRWDTTEGRRDLTRAVLAKWGTPAPVGVEPVARLEIGKTKGGVSLTHIAEPAAFQLPEGMYALYTAPQPVEREPLTEAQVQALIETKHFRSGYELKASDQVCLDWYRQGLRDGEHHHGIKGGQHGAE